MPNAGTCAAARFGGDELGLIVRRATPRAGWEMVDAFRRAVAETEYRVAELLRPEARHTSANGEAGTSAAENDYAIGMKYLKANALREAAEAFGRALALDAKHAASEMELAYVNARLTLDPAKLAETFRITLSVGLAWYRPDDTAERLIERADKLLEAAKVAGRNRAQVEA
jgi:PleD family two-component response regulator